MEPTALEKRNFFLSLSIAEGQSLAQLSGFSVPSEEVQYQEMADVVAKWMTLKSSGILKEVITCVDWMIEATEQFNPSETINTEASRMFMVSFVAATLFHLFEANKIDCMTVPPPISLKDFLGTDKGDKDVQ